MTQAIPKTMRAAAIDRFGGVELFQTRDLPLPDVGPGEVLVRVEVADVATWDREEREGHLADLMKQMGGTPRFPYVLGTDGAGTVAAVGAGVTRVKVGDRVYAMGFLNPKGGFYAEYAAVKAEGVAPIPSTLSIDQAGAMSADALTALQGLDDTLRLKSGESVLIFGAGGGIGHLAVQLAKRLGARVFAVASGPHGVALAKRLGADAAVDGRKDDVVAAAKSFAPDGLDAALFTAGGDVANASLAALRPSGRAAHPEGVEPAPTSSSGHEMKTYSGVPNVEVLAKLNRLIEAGPFHVEVAEVFSFDRAADAHRALEKSHLGKLALRVANGG